MPSRNAGRETDTGGVCPEVEQKSIRRETKTRQEDLNFLNGGVLVRTKLSNSGLARGSQRLGLALKMAALMLAALLMTCVVDRAAAQSIFGRIVGTVMDSQGGAVAGVKITIVNEETKLERHTA